MEETTLYSEVCQSYLELSNNRVNNENVNERNYLPLNFDVRATAGAISSDHSAKGRNTIFNRQRIFILISTLIGIVIGSVCAGFTLYFLMKSSGETLTTIRTTLEMTEVHRQSHTSFETTPQSSSVSGTTKSITPTQYLNIKTSRTVGCSYCPDTWTHFGGSCYKVIMLGKSFTDAELYCNHHGAHLVSVSDGVENSFLQLWLQEMKDGSMWIGLTDMTTNGKWLWSGTKEPFVYNNWGPGQPNGNDEHCVSFEREWQYTWHDYRCSYLKYFICEQ